MTISAHAAAAKAIRAELKAGGVKATVRAKSYAGGGSVYVTLVDALPATVAAVKDALGKYQYGHFDGMTDCYEYSNSRDDLPQVGFVFVDNSYSDDIRAAAWSFVKDTIDGFDGAPAEHSQAWSFNHVASCYSGAVWINRVLAEVRGGFWKSYKKTVSA